MSDKYNTVFFCGPQIWVCGHFSQQILAEVVDIQNALFALSPITVIAKCMDANMLKIWLLGKPGLRPEGLIIVVSPPGLDRATSKSMYEDEFYEGLRWFVEKRKSIRAE
jgi:hypothetical protein